MDNNVYILRCRRTGDAMLIDAANEHEALLEICQRLGVRQVVETHGHWDHIQAVPAVRDAGISVAVTSADAGMLPSYDLILDDDETLRVGDLRITTLATPGSHAGLHLLRRRGHEPPLHRRHPLPRRPGQHVASRAATSRPSSSRSTAASSPRFDPDTVVLPGHGAVHHRGQRGPPPATNGSTGAGEAAATVPVGGRPKPDQNGRLLADATTPRCSRSATSTSRPRTAPSCAASTSPSGAGEVHALMGPNGAGKSTLAGVAAGPPRLHRDGREHPAQRRGRHRAGRPTCGPRPGIFLAFQYPESIEGVSVDPVPAPGHGGAQRARRCRCSRCACS